MVAGASCWLVGWAGTQLWYFRRSRSVVSTRARSVKLSARSADVFHKTRSAAHPVIRFLGLQGDAPVAVASMGPICNGLQD